MPFVVTSCAFKIHRASGRGRGKPVLICILACSLAITFERRSYIKIAFFNDATKLLSLLSLEKVETETWERDKVNGGNSGHRALHQPRYYALRKKHEEDLLALW